MICCATGVSEFLCALVANMRLAWSGDWAWGLPLIVFTVLIHMAGFGLLSRKALHASSRTIRRHPSLYLL